MNSKGYSVPELMVAMLISTIAIVAVYSMHTFYVKNVHTFFKVSKFENRQLASLDFLYNNLRGCDNILAISQNSISYYKNGDSILFSSEYDGIMFKRGDRDAKLLYEGLSMEFSSLYEDTLKKITLVECNSLYEQGDSLISLKRIISAPLQPIVNSDSDWGF